VETFVVMYKTHCQCILDTAINANFDEVKFATKDHICILEFLFIHIKTAENSFLNKKVPPNLVSWVFHLPTLLGWPLVVLVTGERDWSAAKSKETPRTLSSLVHINAPFSSKRKRRGCSASTLTFSHFRFWPYTLNLIDRKRHSDPMAARKRDKQGQFVDFPVFSPFPIAMRYPSRRFSFHALLCNIHCNLVVSDQEFSSPFLARNARSFVTADEYRSYGGCCLCVWFYSL